MSTATFTELKKPLPCWNPKGIYYKTIRTLMGTVGRASDGIDLGYRYGFDSGLMLEYVYQNRSRGKLGIGKIIDRLYLDAPGWKGIRSRGALVTQTLQAEIRDTYERKKRPVKIVDLACGGGRYVLEALANLKDVEVDVLLRDYRLENVIAAQMLARELKLDIRAEQADAFKDADLAALKEEKPDIVIVSGLHEIIDDDDLVRNHFLQIAGLIELGAKLIFTIQPYHPQLEFIARVLPSHTHKPWVMRLRDCELTKGWVESAGFSIENKIMEAQNIFGVVTATRLSK